MNNKVIAVIIIVIVALLAFAGYLWMQQDTPTPENTTPDTTQNTNQTPTEESQTEQQPQESVATITYTDNGFSPSSVTVNAGETVRVQNDSSSTLSFNSDDHPTHNKQSALNVGEIAAGESKTFSIDTVGTWGFHNHLNPAHEGSLLVE